MRQDDVVILVCTTVIQVVGAYIRYFPFYQVLMPGEKRRLARAVAGCAAANILWMGAVLWEWGITIFTYKLLLGLGWIPYAVLSLVLIRRLWPQQIFILGMQAIVYLVLHSLAALVVPLVMPHADAVHIITIQLVAYVVLLGILMPALRRVFRQLLPSRQFIYEKPYSYYIAFLPLLLALSQAPGAASLTLWGTSRLASRLVLGVCFLLLWRYIVLEGRDLEDEVQRQSALTLALKGIRFLKHAALVDQEHRKQMSVYRHDARHALRTLYALAYEGKTQEIQNLVRQLDDELEKTAVHPYCLNPIINAVVSVYFSRMRAAGIALSQKVDLPASLPDLENPLALFLANLLENAITAALTMPEGERRISVKCVTRGAQLVLSVENTFAGTLTLDGAGYPTRAGLEHGHGTGVVSIARFLTRFHGVKSYSQEGDTVKFIAYLALPG